MQVRRRPEFESLIELEQKPGVAANVCRPGAAFMRCEAERRQSLDGYLGVFLAVHNRRHYLNQGRRPKTDLKGNFPMITYGITAQVCLNSHTQRYTWMDGLVARWG